MIVDHSHRLVVSIIDVRLILRKKVGHSSSKIGTIVAYTTEKITDSLYPIRVILIMCKRYSSCRVLKVVCCVDRFSYLFCNTSHV